MQSPWLEKHVERVFRHAFPSCEGGGCVPCPVPAENLQTPAAGALWAGCTSMSAGFVPWSSAASDALSSQAAVSGLPLFLPREIVGISTFRLGVGWIRTIVTANDAVPWLAKVSLLKTYARWQITFECGDLRKVPRLFVAACFSANFR